MHTRVDETDFAALLDMYLSHLRSRRFSSASLARARSVLPRLFEHLAREGVTDPQSASESHLVSFAASLRSLSTHTRIAYLTCARSFFAFLEARGLLLVNLACDLPIPKIRRLPRFVLSVSQAARLMETPDDGSPLGLRDCAILEVLYGSGLRVGECSRLDVTDVDLFEGTLLIRCGKGRKDRFVPLTLAAMRGLDSYLREGRPFLLRASRDALFLSRRRGGRLGVQSIELMVGKHARNAGIKERVSPHALRHSCATHLLRGGADVRHVQAILGHADLATTALYTRVEIRDLREVIERAHPRERYGPRHGKPV